MLQNNLAGEDQKNSLRINPIHSSHSPDKQTHT